MSRYMFVVLVGLGLFGDVAIAAEPGAACVRKQIPQLLKEARGKSAEARPGFLSDQLIHRCSRLPNDIWFILYRGLRLAPHHHKKVPWSKIQTKATLKAMGASWDKVCPGVSSRKLVVLSLGVYKQCKGSIQKLFRGNELKASHTAPFAFGARLFGAFLRLGVPEKEAIAYIRQAYLAQWTFPKLQLQTLRSPLAPRHMTSMRLTTRTLLVNRKKVCDLKGQAFPAALKLGKKAASPVVVPVLEALTEAAGKIRKIARFNKRVRFTGELNLQVFSKTRYQLIHEALSTAYKAGFRKAFALGRAAKPGPLSFLRVIPMALAVSAKTGAKDDAWVIRWRPKGIIIQRGHNGAVVKPGCARWATAGAMPLTLKGATPKALGACVSRLKQLAPQIKRVLLVPAKDVRFQVLVTYFNVLGYSPKGALRIGPLALLVEKS